MISARRSLSALAAGVATLAMLQPSTALAVNRGDAGQGITFSNPPRVFGPNISDSRRPLSSFYLNTESTRLVDLRRSLDVRPRNTFRLGRRQTLLVLGATGSPKVQDNSVAPQFFFGSDSAPNAYRLLPTAGSINTAPNPLVFTRSGTTEMTATDWTKPRVYRNEAAEPTEANVADAQAQPAVEIETVPVEEVAPEAQITKLTQAAAAQTKVEPGQFLIIPAKGEAVLLEEAR